MKKPPTAGTPSRRFNCTFMELKLAGRPALVLLVLFGFNCTFMELKFKCTGWQFVCYNSFNCTFMELKCALISYVGNSTS